MQKAVGYCRVSTEGQAVDGVSLDAQRAKIQAWCAANDFELIGVYVDAGISGKRADNRPELQNALNTVTRVKGALVVYSLSRLARSTKDTISISDRLEKAGSDLVSLSEKLDTTSAAGKMVFRLFAVLSEFERDLVSERTKAALAHMRQQGKAMGQLPFGHDLAADGETLVKNPAELKAVVLIRKLKEQGLSLRAIARQLETEQIPTKSGNASWTHTAVQSILRRSAI